VSDPNAEALELLLELLLLLLALVPLLAASWAAVRVEPVVAAIVPLMLYL
jgi:hypothetical protein